jgi:hypothetical protein
LQASALLVPGSIDPSIKSFAIQHSIICPAKKSAK